MNVPLEVKKQEAIERMKTLEIFPQTIKQFKGGQVSYSEPPLAKIIGLMKIKRKS